MEVIRISGYTEDEKVNIATRYLLPKQIGNNGLKEEEISISKAALVDVVRYYTRESGVRSLEREIAKACRKVTRELLGDTSKEKVSITPKNLEKYLGGSVANCSVLSLLSYREKASIFIPASSAM